eukprot:TRINITY_DN130_c0_g1_i1.p1 TRINITY_DN130_c0_g1~~TRINITY_DN130_c0_g1_i1.p1  ORF type:complete len:150 (-),score=35.19 TRINITY_DN130_c0_g1_i1:83-532(-)
MDDDEPKFTQHIDYCCLLCYCCCAQYSTLSRDKKFECCSCSMGGEGCFDLGDGCAGMTAATNDEHITIWNNCISSTKELTCKPILCLADCYWGTLYCFFVSIKNILVFFLCCGICSLIKNIITSCGNTDDDDDDDDDYNNDNVEIEIEE